ncbi:MAG: MFS transporter [Chloroflexi bacterium]|nr:MFS transporter [Chloroflexota bacterium]
MVALAFLSGLISGIQAYATGVFLKPMSADLNWSRSSFTAVQSIGTLVMGLLGPFLGSTLDRRGGKAIMIFGALVLGSGLMALSQVHSLWQFYLIRGLVVTVGMLCMGNLVVNVAVSNWFVKKRGRAIAFGAMGVSMGGIILIPLTQFLISTLGWRTTWVVYGFMAWAVIIVPTALFMARRPEDVGLNPDGERKANATPSRQALLAPRTNPEASWTRREAVKTSALWLLMVSFGLAFMAVGAMLMHLFPYLTDIGFSGKAAATMLMFQSLMAFFSKPLWGLLVERVHARYCSMAVFFMASVAIFLLLALGKSGMVYLALALFGISFGGFVPLQEVVWANYFGRLTLGAVRSIAMPFSIVTSAGGPLFAGYIYDTTGSYKSAFITFAIIYLVSTLLISRARPPQRAVAAQLIPAQG